MPKNAQTYRPNPAAMGEARPHQGVLQTRTELRGLHSSGATQALGRSHAMLTLQAIPSIIQRYSMHILLLCVLPAVQRLIFGDSFACY